IDREKQGPAFEADRRFVREVEGLLPRGALVYQLPYHPYPEAGPRHALKDYGLFRGYLHSESLRWSYGSMKGREADAWLRSIAALPLDRHLGAVAGKGYEAVYVDRRGFADRGAQLESGLKSVLGPPAVVSADGHLAVYRIDAAKSR
ncbi:MAG TPA: sugar translocase, partial [Burkholderiales bacterium]|nr:sugar translocase [Burkholderiales bacterium]